MSAAPISAGTNPFNPRVVLAMVLFGSVVFIALLWMIGTGRTQGSANDGQAHVGSNGLTGYAAFAGLLEKQGYPVHRLRNVVQLKDTGLVVLTPPMWTKGEDIEKIINDRRYIGPTMLVLPKWQTMAVNERDPKAQKGWVQIVDTEVPDWPKQLGQYALEPKGLGSEKDHSHPQWNGLGESGSLPDARIQYETKEFVAPLILGGDGRILAGYWHDHGYYPDLLRASGNVEDRDEDEDTGLFPLIVVAEPDLMDNWGMAEESRARAALALVRLAEGGRHDPVSFDMTLNGYKSSTNLLTLAFRPPFLAATLCLLLAALVAGWRALRRFGPPVAESRAVAFGKRALIANSAGLIRRSGRLHLLAAPYAQLVRDRLARTLALPRHLDGAATEAAIDRALAARDASARPFSHAAATLRAARRPADLLHAGQAIHDIERKLTR